MIPIFECLKRQIKLNKESIKWILHENLQNECDRKNIEVRCVEKTISKLCILIVPGYMMLGKSKRYQPPRGNCKISGGCIDAFANASFL